VKELTQIENFRVEIRRRSYQRSMNLRVEVGGGLKVTCGKSVSLRQITGFVRDSREFIQKRVLHFEALRLQHPEKQYLSGEIFLFLGRRRTLEVVWTWASRVRLTATEAELEMLAPLSSTQGERMKACQRFYRKQAQLHLAERVAHFAAAMDLQPKKLTIRGQSTRWGSCSSQGLVSLNWKLMAAPEEVIDYVVIHELAHLQHMNHSPRFWELVGRFQVEWRASKRWLREHEFELGVQFPRRVG